MRFAAARRGILGAVSGEITPAQLDSLRRAIAVVTAWLEGGEGDRPGFGSSIAGAMIQEDVNAGEPSRLVAGFITLAGILLEELSEATHRSPAEILSTIAIRLDPDA